MLNPDFIRRFGPLLGLGAKKASDLSDGDFKAIAGAFGGEHASEAFYALLTKLAKLSPGENAINLLTTPEAANLMKKINEAREAQGSSIMVACPFCKRHFESDL